MNLETGKNAVTAERSEFGRTKRRDVRWGMPQVSDDGALAVANVRAADNKDRWLVAVDPESGKTRVVDALHDDAWVREVGGFGPTDPSFGWLPDQKQPVVPLRARRLDAPVHRRCARRRARPPAS